MNAGPAGSGFGQVIRRARIAAGLTLEGLAERTGLGVRTISDIERGRTARPRSATVTLLCGPLGMPLPLARPGGLPGPAAGAVPRPAAARGIAREAAPGAPAAGSRCARCPGDRRVLRGRPQDGRIVPRQLPARPGHFVGREAEAGLLDTLTRPHGAAVSVIGGAPGTGKTALALHAAHRAAGRFPDGQLYLSLRASGPAGPLAPADALGRILAALEVAARRVPDGLDARAGLYRSLLAVRRMLIVLDDACDSAQVTPLLPGGSACSVIVTSRARLPGLVAAHHAAAVALGPLDPARSLELLAARIGSGRAAAEPAAAAELAALSGGFPLAIGAIAARAVTGPPRPLAALAAELRTRPAWLHAPGLLEEPGDLPDRRVGG
jgi:transcriptional regulator with XRE-family HTH domain